MVTLGSEVMYGFQERTAPGPIWQPNPWLGTGQQWKYDWTMNMWRSCPKCSKLVQWGSSYCPSCGEKMYEEITGKDKLEQILDKLDEILEELKKGGN